MARRKRVHTLASFVVKKSPGRGKGVFAKVRIGKGETIGYYTGDILRDWHSTREPYNSSLYLMYVCKDHWINAVGPRSNYTRYINHSYRPNADLIVSTRWKTARIESLRVIKPHEEIFYSYGDEYWEALEVEPL